MENWVVGIYVKTLAAILCLLTAVWLALWYFIPAPPSTILIASGIKGGAFEHLALRYKERLARDHVTLDVRITEGALDSLRLIEDPNSGIDAAFLFGGITNSQKSPGLMSLGRFNHAPIWIFYRGTEQLDRLTQLKGKRLAVGVAFGIVATQILAPHGVNPDNTTLLPLIGPAAVKALKDGEADAVLQPFELNSPLVQTLLRDPAVRLMSLTQADALTRVFPFLTRLVLPQGVIDLERNIPSSDVILISTTNAVVVRKDLHPEIVFLLAQTLLEEHGGAGIFQRAGDFPTQTDPEFAVAEEARELYRNGPSFLQRYLPFWMINFAKRTTAVLLAVMAIVLPILNYAPKLYSWLLRAHLRRLYRRLRAVETEMQTELTAPRVLALQTDIVSIGRAAHILPVRHSDLFFALRLHIDQTRARLAARLVELRNQTRKR